MNGYNELQVYRPHSEGLAANILRCDAQGTMTAASAVMVPWGGLPATLPPWTPAPPKVLAPTIAGMEEDSRLDRGADLSPRALR